MFFSVITFPAIVRLPENGKGHQTGRKCYMIKIFKNMIPYWRTISVIVLLLMVQAFCDLALPQYTSDIIDVGIINGGVSHILPQKIREEEFESAKLFMSEEEKKAFERSYTLAGDGVYVRSVEEEQALEELDQTLLMPILLRSYVKNGQAQEDMPMLSQEEMEQMSASVGDNTLLSMGIAYAKACEAEAGVDVDKRQMDYLWSEGGKMFLMAMLMLLASVGIGYLASKVGAGIGQGLRSSIFQKVVSFSNSEMDRFSTASLITRSTNDIQQIQMVTAILLRMILYAPIIGIGGIYKVAQTGAGMGWIIALAVIVIVGFVLLLVSVAMPKFKMMQKLVDGLNLVSREILTGLSVIRAFGREKREEERFDAANRSLMKTQLFTNRVMNLMMPGMMFVMYGVTLLIVWVSAHRIDDGSLQVGAMTAFITYAMQIVMSFLMLTMMSIMLPRAGVAAERIDEVLTTEVSIEEPKQSRTLTNHQGVVSFSHVYFRYREAKEDVLEDIDFTARPGEVTAIIGSTGCGKSTLVNLLPRFYDVTGGSITIDGEDIRTLSLKELRNEIGFVPQKGVLFSGTIASNLRFGNSDADDTLIREAAEIAQASDFIEEKNEGYESAIAQGGSNVSGGQKQRLAIARAIAKQPRIFIFDDSFSALDMKTDAKLRKALEQKVKDSTVIIVAQRISTILNADQILVLDDGKIAGRGTHEELLAGCEVYRQIAKSQLSAKELGIAEGEEEHHE